MWEKWKFTIPRPVRVQPIIETLKNLAEKHPGILLVQPMVPDYGPRPVEEFTVFVERDLSQGSISQEMSELLRGPNFVWGYDDLGFVNVIMIDQKKEWIGAVYKEAEEGGLPVGRLGT